MLRQTPPETSSRNIDYHESETTQSPYLFCDLNIFIVPLIIKSIFALNRKYNIGYHNDCNKNQPKNIKSFHIIYHHKLRFVEMFGDSVLNEKGWKTKPLLDMGKCKNGMNFHYDDSGVEINCLGVGDFKDLSVIDNTEQLPTVSLNEMPSEEYLLKDDDIVFVRSNGNKALVGRSVAVYPGDIPTTFSGFCIRYRKYDNAVTIPYLLRVLKADSIRKKMAGRGTNIQNLNQQILGTLIIPVPPIELQMEFSDFVKQVDKSKFSSVSLN